MREKLCELEIPHKFVAAARGSPKVRQTKRYGRCRGPSVGDSIGHAVPDSVFHSVGHSVVASSSIPPGYHVDHSSRCVGMRLVWVFVECVECRGSTEGW